MTRRILARLAARLRRPHATTAPAGRHHNPDPVAADWSPLDPRSRQHLAPTHYADRALHADVDQPTALMPALGEVA